jgi:hypothetical protein
MRMISLTEENWSDYLRDGFMRLGEVLGPDEVALLRERADDLATGRVSNPAIEMQLDTGGSYGDLAETIKGSVGTLAYRKIRGLETDDHFAKLLRHPEFLELSARHYGAHAPIATVRAIIMNKPAGLGTVIPWHQDGGDAWQLDRDPLVTIWVALDPATVANGCLEAVGGSHRLGMIDAFRVSPSDEDVARYCTPDRVVTIELEAGHAVLMHNWLIHRSGVNPTSAPRRAFLACYIDGRTQSKLTGVHFPMVAGAPPPPHPFVREKDERIAALEEYAASLRDDNVLLRRSRDEAAAYAHSLEAELARRGSGAA